MAPAAVKTRLAGARPADYACPMSIAAIVPAVSVALLKGREVLLVRRGRAPSRGLYAFPGGRVEAGEALEDAARRELFEETGLEAGPLSVFQTIDLPVERGGDEILFRLTVFTGRWTGGDPVAADDAEAAGWFGLDDLAALPATESTIAAALVLLADGPSFTAS